MSGKYNTTKQWFASRAPGEEGQEIGAGSEPADATGSVKVGDVGQFKDAFGRMCQCVVRGFDEAPWEDDLLIVDYVHPVGGYKVTGAMIGRDSFIPDNSPNTKPTEDAK